MIRLAAGTSGSRRTAAAWSSASSHRPCSKRRCATHPAGHVHAPRDRGRAPRSTRSRGQVAVGARVRARPDLRRAEVRVGARRRAPRNRTRARARGCARASRRRPASRPCTSAAPTLFSACTRISVSPSRSASPIASSPYSIASRAVAGEHASCDALLYAIASSRPGGSALEQLDRAPALAHGGRAVGGEPGQSRQPPAVVPLAHAIARWPDAAPAPPGAPRRRRRSAGSGSTRTTAAPTAPRAAPASSAAPCLSARRELLGGLAMDAQPRGALARGRRVAQHGLDVAGRVGVVGQPGRVDRPVRRRRQRPRAPRGGARPAGRVRSRPRPRAAPARAGTRPRRPRGRASRSRGRPRAARSPRPRRLRAATARSARGTTAAASSSRRGAGASCAVRASTASRTVSGMSRLGRGQRLGDEERIAAGPLEQLAPRRPRRARPASGPRRATAAGCDGARRRGRPRARRARSAAGRPRSADRRGTRRARAPAASRSGARAA